MALDLGSGFTLTGSVELEYINSPSVDESLSFTDVTLGWRSQSGAAFGFGADVTFRADRFLNDGESENMIWAAVVMTTGFGEFAIGRPVPALSSMFDVPQVGGARYVDRIILEAGGTDGSFLRELSFFTDLSSSGLTFRGNSNGLGNGIGAHRYKAGPRFRWPGFLVLDRRALAPLRNSLGVDAKLPAQLRERSLRSLYCSSDSERGRGAPVTNLSHSASFHFCERIAPSNRGIKHLGPGYFRKRHPPSPA